MSTYIIMLFIHSKCKGKEYSIQDGSVLGLHRSLFSCHTEAARNFNEYVFLNVVLSVLFRVGFLHPRATSVELCVIYFKHEIEILRICTSFFYCLNTTWCIFRVSK